MIIDQSYNLEFLIIGKLTCGVKDCGNVELIHNPQNLPAALRTIGKIFERKEVIMDDSHAEFERDPKKILDVANGICDLHGLVNTHVSGALRSGCDECLEQAEEAFVEIKKLNKILMESQIVSSAKAKGTKASIQLKKAIKEREEEIKGLVDLKKEVNKYFDKLHNILRSRKVG